MNKIKYIILVLSAALVSFAQSQEDPCMEELKALYQKTNEFFAGIDPGKTLYLNYSVRAVTGDSISEPPLESAIELWLSGRLIEVKSPQMQVFQDEKEAFIIVSPKKLLVRNDAAINNKKDLTQKKYLDMQDTLLKLSKHVLCRNIKSMDGPGKQITLDINEEGMELTGISRIVYLIDEQKKEFKKIRMYYDTEGSSYKTSGIVYVDYSFNKMDANFKGKKLSSKVAGKFVKENNTLRNEYKGYTLVDNRNKKQNLKAQ